jgi:hypothetical protein
VYNRSSCIWFSFAVMCFTPSYTAATSWHVEVRHCHVACGGKTFSRGYDVQYMLYLSKHLACIIDQRKEHGSMSKWMRQWIITASYLDFTTLPVLHVMMSHNCFLSRFYHLVLHGHSSSAYRFYIILSPTLLHFRLREALFEKSSSKGSTVWWHCTCLAQRSHFPSSFCRAWSS